MLEQLSFYGSDFIGVCARAGERYAVVGRMVPDSVIEEIEHILSVEVLKTTIANTNIVGSMIAMNSNGMMINELINPEEEKKLREAELRIGHIGPKFNAAGNMILVNDKRALISPRLSKNVMKGIEDTFCVEVVREDVGLYNVGMAFSLSNKGVLCHPDVSDETLRKLEELFGVRGGWGTVNHGFPFVGSGVLCNSKSVVIGKRTTTVEITRIQDAFDV